MRVAACRGMHAAILNSAKWRMAAARSDSVKLQLTAAASTKAVLELAKSVDVTPQALQEACSALTPSERKDIATATDEGGRNVLHLVCANRAISAALILAAAECVTSDAVKATCKDAMGFADCTVMHLLCGNVMSSVEAMHALHTLHPGAVTLPNWFGMLPLHQLAFLDLTHDPERFVALLCACHALHPDAISAKHKWGYTPLNVFVWATISEPTSVWSANRALVAAALYKLWPDAVYETDVEGRTPLLTACRRRNTLVVIRAVDALEPSVAETAGLTPLHLVCAAADATPCDVREAADAISHNSHGLSALSAAGETPLDLLHPKAEDVAIHAALCAAFPLEAFRRRHGATRPLLDSACKTTEGAEEALGALCVAHTTGGTTTLSAVDPTFLPSLLCLSARSLEVASSTPVVKRLVDSLNARAGPIALLLLDLEVHLALCVRCHGAHLMITHTPVACLDPPHVRATACMHATCNTLLVSPHCGARVPHARTHSLRARHRCSTSASPPSSAPATTHSATPGMPASPSHSSHSTWRPESSHAPPPCAAVGCSACTSPMPLRG